MFTETLFIEFCFNPSDVLKLCTFSFDTLNHERLIVFSSKHVNMKATNVSPQILHYLSKK